VLVLGVTGVIGSGKSAVAELMAKKGAKTIDADVIARRVVAPGSQILVQITDEFGQDILRKDGTLDRKKLADIVFNDPLKLKMLNKITHPVIIDSIRERIEKQRSSLPDKEVVVIDAPLLAETELLSLVNILIVVIANEKICLERLLKKGYSREDAMARARAQTSPDVLVKHADYVIENEGTLDELKEKVDELWEKIVGR